MATSSPMLPGLGGGPAPSTTPTTLPSPQMGAVNFPTIAPPQMGTVNFPQAGGLGAVGNYFGNLASGNLAAAFAPPPQTTPLTGGIAGNPAPQPAQPAQPDQPAQPAQPPPNMLDLLNLNDPNNSAQFSDMAAKFGTQAPSPTQAADVGQKYQDFHAANKGTEAPATNPRADIADATKTSTPQEDPQKSLFDNYGSMNPPQKALYDGINSALSSTTAQQSLTEEFNKAFTDVNNPAGIPGESLSQEQLQAMNIKNVMDGTETDIRNEITKAGGFATDSQVMALTGARNKVLMKQATSLQQSMQLKQDYVDHLMNFSQLDRAAVEKQVDQKIGLEEKLVTLSDSMQKAAKDNYQNIVDKIGYSGLAASTGGNKYQQGIIEQVMGLPSGALSNPTFLSSAKAAPTAALQEYQFAQGQGFKGTFMDFQTQQKQATSGTWGAPYSLGGDIVQQNSATGEIRTAVNVPQGNTTSTATEGTDLGLAKAAITKGNDPAKVRQAFLADHPSAGAAWDNYFGTPAADVTYPTPAKPAEKPWWQWW